MGRSEFMNKSSAIKKAAKVNLEDNWSKAFASMGIMLVVLLLLFLSEQLLVEILRHYGIINQIDAYVGDVDALKNWLNWLSAYFADKTTMYVNLIAVAFMFFGFLIVTPLRLGITTWYYTVAASKNAPLGNTFIYYRSNGKYIDSLLFTVRLFIRKLVCGIIAFAAPGVALAMTITHSINYVKTENEKELSSLKVYAIIAGVLLVAGLFLYAFLALRYFVSRYLFAKRTIEDNKLSITKCFSDSKRYMVNNKKRVIMLFFSFIPLFLLCVFIIPIIYVMPYYNGSIAQLADDIIDMNERYTEV